MALYIPNPNSIRDLICRAIHKADRPITPTEISEAVGCVRNTLHSSLSDLKKQGAIKFSKGYWDLTLSLRQHYDQCEPIVDEAREIVSGRFVKPFQPLKSLPWAQHLDKIRDISFHTASGAFKPLGYRI